ncbi:MAG: helix-turn-helix transcriptional regulator [Polyangiales bacterium]
MSLEAEYADSLVTVRCLTPSTEDTGAIEALRAFGTLTRMLSCVSDREVSARAARAPQRLHAVVNSTIGCDVQDHPSELAVCFDAHDVQRPNARADLPLYEVLTRHAEQRLVDLTSQKTVDTRVRETIAQLSTGSARAYVVAARLGIGVRTLHRRLRAEGTSFRRIHDEMRMERCLRELKSGAVTAKHVAQQLGFADPASFHRAFKRWTGSTVRGYRGQSPRRRGVRATQQPRG